MTQENVDRFREMVEAFNRIAAVENAAEIDPGDVMDLLGTIDAEVEFEPQQALLQGSYRGHDGVMAWLADIGELYRGGRMNVEEIRDLGDRALALGTLRVIGRASGIEIDVPLAIVASFRRGLVVRLRDYGEHAQALEAVGLSE